MSQNSLCLFIIVCVIDTPVIQKVLGCIILEIERKIELIFVCEA